MTKLLFLLVTLASPAEWDPSKAVDLKALKTRQAFAVRDSAVCPTQAQAKARRCGNSVEFKESGIILRKGAGVTLVGDKPLGDYWKAIRFQKAGTLPSWVLASDVADKPLTDALDAFDKKPRKGLVFKRLRTVRVGTFDGKQVTLYADINGHPTALRWKVPDDHRFPIHHTCLVYGDCIELDYVCGKDYCDEVSVEARPTKAMIGPPDDPEGEWPKGWSKAGIQVYRVVEIADRFGTFGPGETKPMR